MINQTQTTLERIVKPGREGWVYLIHAEGANRYKIGRSVNPIVRHQTLQKQSPYPLTIIDSFWTLDAVSDETYLHQMCEKQRVYGEWFEFNRPLKNLFYFARGAWSSNTKTLLYESHLNFLYNTSQERGFFQNEGFCSTLFCLYDHAKTKADFELIDKTIHLIILEKLNEKYVDYPSLNISEYITGILDGVLFQLSDYKEECEE